MNALTKKQMDFLTVLKELMNQADQAPTISELQSALRARGFAAKSRRSVSQYLDALESKGLISRTSEARGINIVEPQSEVLLNIPILGMANAGAATSLAEEHFIGFLQVSKKLLKKQKELFAVEVRGNSMDRANIGGLTIDDGDWIVVDKSAKQPKNGDYVLSVCEGAANVKKFYFDKENGQIILSSESSEQHPPIFIHPDDSYLIGGKVIQVIKRPKL